MTINYANQSENFRDADHQAMFQRLLLFQEYVNTHYAEDNLREFIRLSQLVFCTYIDDTFVFFDYMQVTFKYISVFGQQIITQLEPGTKLTDIWVSIPCGVDNCGHAGVDCRLTSHLSGMGCFDCAHDFGLSGFYPIE